MWHGDMGFGGWWMIAGSLMWLGLLAVIIAGVWALTNRRQDAAFSQAPPLEILKGRYAAGEITRQEFEEKRRDLTGGLPGHTGS